MSRQLVLDLPRAEAYGRADFLPAPCNAQALAMIEAPDSWPGGKLALVGPEGAGKTHLAHIWSTEAAGDLLEARALTLAALPKLGAAVAVENADQLLAHPEAQEALFHLHNHLHNQGGRLLVTGRTPPAHWAFSLPDLASRLTALHVVEVSAPDDTLLSALLGKLFSDRQIAPPPSVIPYLVSRMDRSFATAREIVAEIDHRALSEGREITRGLAAEVLDNPGEITH